MRDEALGSDPPPSSGDDKIGNVAEEVSEATVRLSDSVDQIVGVLLLVLGKIGNLTTALRLTVKSARTASAVSVFNTLLIVAVGAFMIYRIESTNDRVSETERTVESSAVKVDETIAKANAVLVAVERTDRKVEAVKQSAEEKPTVEIVPDTAKTGGAVVRIIPPKKRPSVEDKHAPTASSAVEIPLRLQGARRGK